MKKDKTRYFEIDDTFDESKIIMPTDTEEQKRSSEEMKKKLDKMLKDGVFNKK